MKHKAESAEYPDLKGRAARPSGKCVLANDEELTALIIEFEDNTRVGFRLKAAIDLLTEPEMSTLKDGNIVNWKKLKAHPVKRRGATR